MAGVSLATAMEAIPGAIITILNTARTAPAEAPPLAEVEAVIRGDRSRGRKEIPVIWVLPERADATSTRVSMAEEWDLSVALVAIVKNADPETGNKKAIELASKARGLFLTKGNRTLGLNYVRDIKSGRFEPNSPYDGEGNIFAALAELKIDFLTQE